MTTAAFLEHATRMLITAGIETARLDSIVLLEDELRINRTSILAHPERDVDTLTERRLNTKIAQRSNHTPLAYIRGKAHFYGRKFLVNKYVLCPRPESEAMIDVLKNLPLPAKPRIADIGTGSGCLGLTAALEIPHTQIELWDVDQDALAVAKTNAAKYNIQATYVRSDLFKRAPNKNRYNALLVNLPYVPTGYPINRAASYEPSLALFGGEDGLDVYRRFWQQVSELPCPPTHILTESFPSQHPTMTALAGRASYHLKQTNDFVQHFQKG